MWHVCACVHDTGVAYQPQYGLRNDLWHSCREPIYMLTSCMIRDIFEEGHAESRYRSYMILNES
jgi:hypothetical protein